MRKLFAPLLLILGMMFLPGFALAASIDPVNGNAWDLYVFGNGRVIFDILTGVKMLMVPDGGSTGFIMLLLLLATIGFIVLAIGAGFDPGKNLLRMFTYILVVWGVIFGTTKLTANLNITDLVAEKGVTNTYTVEGVPALVALPGALTSQIGHYFGRVIETYFTLPGEFKLAGGGVGQFNLFAKMMEESNQYVLTSPELKKSLSAYVSDCVVPAIALGMFNGAGNDDMGQNTIHYGVSALTRTTNLLDALGTATHKSIMTKYYPMSPNDISWMSKMSDPEINAFASGNLNAAGSFGVVVTCQDAYAAISADVERDAAALLDAGTNAWSKAGIMTPFTTAFQSMLANAAATGSPSANFSSPSGFIMQQAMINSMNGSFRQAAIQTGNNELMQAAALSQAEQSQKSSWVSGFMVFNNMMGYVFTVLQAFIFAITPMVVVALMIPGMGKAIFTNYAQILVWLTLWMPMLALINYIITLFGSESMSIVVSMEGGLSVNNKALISEKTNDLMIAAQFLGTMTPLITWGIVKGAMAFTEFISSGVGSAFASQAGAAAATGNLSMNNMSMDNTSMNKFNTAMASTVGTQGINGFANAGALDISQGLGGGSMTANGSGIDMKQQMSDQLSKSIGENKQIQSALEQALQSATSYQQARDIIASHTEGSAREHALQKLNQYAVNASRGDSLGNSKTLGDNLSDTDAASQRQNVSNRVSGGLEAKAGGSVGFASGNANASVERAAGVENGNSRDSAKTALVGDTRSLEEGKVSLGESGSRVTQDSQTSKKNEGNDLRKSASESESASVQNSLRQALSDVKGYTESLQAMQSVVSSFGVANSLDIGSFNNMRDQMSNMLGSMKSHDEIQAEMRQMAGHLSGNRDEALTHFDQARFDALNNRIAAERQSYAPGQYAPAPGSPGAAFMARTEQEFQDKADIFRKDKAERERAITQRREEGAIEGGALQSWAGKDVVAPNGDRTASPANLPSAMLNSLK